MRYLLDDKQIELAKKYRNGRVVDDEDLAIVDELHSGFSTGFTTLSDGIIRVTAKTTKFMKERLRLTKILRNPIRRTLYCLVNTVS